MSDWAAETGVGASPFPPIAEYGFLSDCETCALVAPNSAEEEHAAELARSPRDSTGTGDDPLGEVAMSGHGTDEDAGEYLNK